MVATLQMTQASGPWIYQNILLFSICYDLIRRKGKDSIKTYPNHKEGIRVGLIFHCWTKKSKKHNHKGFY